MRDISFSVVIPLYNKEKYISRAINSVLKQTHPQFELIIVNDGSTDNGESVVKSFNDIRIRYLEQENFGVSAARNKGIRLAEYNFVALLDADDEWEPNFLKEIVEAIETKNNCIAYASAYTKIKMNGQKWILENSLLPTDEGILKNYFKALFRNGPILSSSSICINKMLLLKEGLLPLFPKGVKRGEDLDAWTRMALNNEIYYINKSLVNIYSVKESTSNLTKYNHKEAFDYYQWLDYESNSQLKKAYLKKVVFQKIRKLLLKLLLELQLKEFINVFYRYTKKRMFYSLKSS